MEFTETQRLNLNWIYILIAIETLVIGLMLLGGTRAEWERGEEAYYLPVVVLLVSLAIFPLIRNMKLVFGLDSDGVRYQVSFFLTRKYTIGWAEIEKAYLRKVDALGEYGGWGIKHRLWFKTKDKAYIFNLENRGLQLELKNGRKLLFSSGKTAELELFLINLRTRYGIKEITDHA